MPGRFVDGCSELEIGKCRRGFTFVTMLAGKIDRADVGEETQVTALELFHQYEVYGIGLRTSFPLCLPERSSAALIEVEVRLEPAGYFSDMLHDTPLQLSPFGNFSYAQLQDGSSYVIWNCLGEFLVSSDGRRIACRRFAETSLESFQVYLLGQAIAFALVKNGLEPLHATCVVIDGKTIALLGDSGYGKSSLAACFLEAGHRLLTDDLLVLREVPDGFEAYPGPPRIKLFPHMARRFLGESLSGVPMNSGTRKLIMPLEPERVCAYPEPLAAIYAIAAPDDAAQEQGVRIESVRSREAYLLLMSNIFNYVIMDSARQQRLLRLASRWACLAPVKWLFYPRSESVLPLVREAILGDLRRI
jgi:hypothetical protein